MLRHSSPAKPTYGKFHGQDRQHLGPVRQQGQGAHWRLCQQEEAGLGADLQQGK